jgi:hypothetical protein
VTTGGVVGVLLQRTPNLRHCKVHRQQPLATYNI